MLATDRRTQNGFGRQKPTEYRFFGFRFTTLIPHTEREQQQWRFVTLIDEQLLGHARDVSCSLPRDTHATTTATAAAAAAAATTAAAAAAVTLKTTHFPPPPVSPPRKIYR